MDRDPPASTGAMGSIPGLGRFHVQLVCHNYPSATTSKPINLEDVLHNKRRPCSEKPMHPSEERPPPATARESLRQQRRPSTTSTTSNK